MFILTALFVL